MTESKNGDAVPSKTAVADADTKPTSQISQNEEPPAPVHVKYDIDEILHNDNQKKFVDEKGNELSEEEVKALLEAGGSIKSVENAQV